MSTQIRVQSLAAGGEGIGRLEGDGQVVFVYGGLPGDLWQGQTRPLGRKALKLVAAERLEDGPHRIDARCGSRPSCGGCDWHELAPVEALGAKRQVLVDCLERLANYTPSIDVESLEIKGAVTGRYRVGLKVGEQGLAYSAHASHELVPLIQCEALAPALESVMLNVSSNLHRLPPGIIAVQASLSADGRHCAARLTVSDVLTPPAIKHLCQAVLRETALDGVWVVTDQGVVEAGQVRLSGLIATGFSKRYRLRGGGFHQAIPAVNEALVRVVVAEAKAQRRQRIVDMHGGAGNFGLVLAGKGADVTISETDPHTCDDLKLNAEAFRGRGVVHVAEMKGAQALLRCSKRGPVDAVVFDAPRTGDSEGAKVIAAVRPKRVVALGCDPATFARDLKLMGIGERYRLTRLGLWDAFPGTHHSESLAVLELIT